MKKITSRVLYLILLSLVIIIPMACDEKESDLGINLQDPSTIYDGIDTIVNVTAYTVFDDSLRTSGISSTIVGRYNSPIYGPSEAIYYTQLGLPSDEGISINENYHIDSIVLNLRIESFQPFSTDSSNQYNLHFEIRQLANQLIDTNTYYSDTAFTVGELLYDQSHMYKETDTLLSFKLNENSYKYFRKASSQSEFQENLKGLRIKLKDNSGEDAMVVISLAAISSKVRMYYKYGEDPKQLTYDFYCGQKIGHYTQFVHDYSGTPLRGFINNHADTMKNDPLLYLTPMGGTNIYVRMDDFLTEFHQHHPSAVVHYAEMLLPVEALSDGADPDKLYAYRYSATGYVSPIADILDHHLFPGFDGTYDEDNEYYRMRMSRHIQQLLRTQEDYGTLIVLNSRRSSALSVVVNKPIKIKLIYTEISKEL